MSSGYHKPVCDKSARPSNGGPPRNLAAWPPGEGRICTPVCDGFMPPSVNARALLEAASISGNIVGKEKSNKWSNRYSRRCNAFGVIRGNRLERCGGCTTVAHDDQTTRSEVAVSAVSVWQASMFCARRIVEATQGHLPAAAGSLILFACAWGPSAMQSSSGTHPKLATAAANLSLMPDPSSFMRPMSSRRLSGWAGSMKHNVTR